MVAYLVQSHEEASKCLLLTNCIILSTPPPNNTGSISRRDMIIRCSKVQHTSNNTQVVVSCSFSP